MRSLRLHHRRAADDARGVLLNDTLAAVPAYYMAYGVVYGGGSRTHAIFDGHENESHIYTSKRAYTPWKITTAINFQEVCMPVRRFGRSISNTVILTN